jgi:hypothetical protein
MRSQGIESQQFVIVYNVGDSSRDDFSFPSESKEVVDRFRELRKYPKSGRKKRLTAT